MTCMLWTISYNVWPLVSTYMRATGFRFSWTVETGCQIRLVWNAMCWLVTCEAQQCRVSVKRTSIYIYKQCKAVKAKQIELELLQAVAMETCTNLILWQTIIKYN